MSEGQPEQVMALPAPVGMLGGTFDPIHFGHLRLAEEAVQQLGLSKVMLLPAGTPPHRQPPRAAPEHRLAMAERAISNNPRLGLDAGEVYSDGPSYTVLTLERLRAQLGPTQPLVLILGADAFLGLATWHRWREILALAHIAVATRPNHLLEPEHMAAELATLFSQRLQRKSSALAAAPAGAIVPFGITPLDISATAIRGLLGTGGSARYLLPEDVLDYIATHHLYRKN